MSLETVSKQLTTHLRDLQEAVTALRLTVVEDKPASHIIVDQLSNAIDDVLGCSEEAVTVVLRASNRRLTPIELARQTLVCQRLMINARERLNTELASYEIITQLIGLGKERRGEWFAWTSSVKEAIEQCQDPMQNCSDTLVKCWQEVVDYLESTTPLAKGTASAHRSGVHQTRGETV